MRLCIPWTTSLMSSVGESCILVLCTAAVVTDNELQLLQLHVREKKMSGLNGEVGDGEVATGQQGNDCWQRVRNKDGACVRPTTQWTRCRRVARMVLGN